MPLSTNAQLGHGGAGFQGDGPESAAAMIKELQGLNIELLAGAAADTKIDVAAIRDEDTVLKALNNAAGTITDITGTISIEDLVASGTLTGTTVVATDNVTVNGMVYTFQAGAPVSYGQVQVGGSDDDSMANLADAINAYEGSIGKGGADVSAVAVTTVVTVSAVVAGAVGNAIDISSGQGSIVASGATLADGSDTGGIQSTGITDQVILFWYNKEA
ncbi:MAG: hypothetical protein KAJ73_00280 [Zetaproteobacteria bacterium]|nr:hypothetical protein [Zetaproteobacteria bacterium]